MKSSHVIFFAAVLICIFIFKNYNANVTEKKTTSLPFTLQTPDKPNPPENIKNLQSFVQSFVKTKEVLSRSSEPQSIDHFLQEKDPDAKWTILKNSKHQILSVSGGLIHGAGQNPQMGLALARDMAAFLNVDQKQLQIDTQFNLESENLPHDVFNYKQYVSGYEVYRSYLRLFVRNSDQSVYFVNNELKLVQKPDLNVFVSLDQANSRLYDVFENKKIRIEKTESAPLIFVNKLGQSELVWRSIVKIQSPLLDRREVLISASTGEVVQNLSLVVY